MLRFGTAHFRTLRHAIAYYGRMDETEDDVIRRIDRKEITIGMPPIQPGDMVGYDEDGRWWVAFAQLPGIEATGK